MIKIPISVIVLTKNEEARITRCLNALQDFDEVFVVDSNSTDNTAKIVQSLGVEVVFFEWDGQYPKKKQWAAENLPISNDYIFHVDADEVLTPDLVEEIRGLNLEQAECAGYFVRGANVLNSKVLRFGLRNNKLALYHREKLCYPAVDDLDIDGGWEVEGHYQPILKPEYKGEKIGQLKAPLLHYAYEDQKSWQERHQHYAAWESGMNERGAWPDDVQKRRTLGKRLFRRLPASIRGLIAFVHSYFYKLGFLDGKEGLELAWSRFGYYRMIRS